MRNLITTVIIGLVGLSFSMADSFNFDIIGSNTINEVLENGEKLDKSEFLIRNTSNKDLELGWRCAKNTLLEGWDYSMCAYGTCSIGIPESGLFRKIKPGEDGFIALHLFPKRKAGHGYVVFQIYELDTPKIYKSVAFDITVMERKS